MTATLEWPQLDAIEDGYYAILDPDDEGTVTYWRRVRTARANRCLRHPGSPVDPTAENGCLLCGSAHRRPARPIPNDFVPGDVLRHIEEHGQDAATERYGPQAVTRALIVGGRHPSKQQLAVPAAEVHTDEGEI
ncbi:hypothetical protein VSR01_17465 [Actinacidiphila sp. DG2A-62]|uniref:hypothetical protein n=1 Tax=Actinacidiphila sp. DG2A-62 TaxID=3108821 RepID=UPI002DBB3C4E|nr:hypothetical protein [Actinacidiphila sp. DG2A-62]MEC3995228.1 hypothetical protein [Actinacidiphila sp. DG2A-62]